MTIPPLSVEGMTWPGYVRVITDDINSVIARKLGISQPSVSRWFKGSQPDPASAATFARVYSRPVIEAFVAAGYLTAHEAGRIPTAAHPPLADLTDAELLTEVARRMRGGQSDAGQAEAQKSPGVVPGLDGLRRVDHLRAAAEGESSKDHDDDGGGDA